MVHIGALVKIHIPEARGVAHPYKHLDGINGRVVGHTDDGMVTVSITRRVMFDVSERILSYVRYDGNKKISWDDMKDVWTPKNTT